MLLHDPLYGSHEVDEPVILELLSEPAVLRLQGIKQSGLIAFINRYPEFSRYDHSVGCMLLLRHLGATVEEQVAALLHDVSHTAFSYVVDRVFSDDEEQSYHDIFRERIIFNSNIPAILEKYDLSAHHVLEKHNFILLERKTPSLCADRVDYALRTLYHYFNKHKLVTEYLKGLINYNGEMVFLNREIAARFAHDFLDLDIHVYTDLRNQTVFALLAKAIRLALDKNFLSEDDFLLTDEELLHKMSAIPDQQVLELIAQIGPDFQVVQDKTNYDFILYTKPRYVDPAFLESDGLHTLSHDDPEFAAKIVAHKRTIVDEHYARIVKN